VCGAETRTDMLSLYNIYLGQGCDPNVKRERLVDKMGYLTKHAWKAILLYDAEAMINKEIGLLKKVDLIITVSEREKREENDYREERIE